MPRMSKSKKLEWSFFLNDRGRKAYNTLCRRCVHDCKQSFRAVVVICPHYQSKRAKGYKAGGFFGSAHRKRRGRLRSYMRNDRHKLSALCACGSER